MTTLVNNVLADLAWHTARLRGILAVLVALCWGLATAPPAQDSLVMLGQSRSLRAWALFVGATLWLGVSAWFWSCFALDVTTPPRAEGLFRRRQRLRLKLYVPRVMALIPFFGVGAALLGAAAEIPQGMRSMMGAEQSGDVVLVRAAALIVLLGFLLLGLLGAARHWRIGRRLGNRRGGSWVGGAAMGVASLGLASAGMAFYGFTPVQAGEVLQPGPTILLAAAGLVCGLTIVTLLGRRLHVPILSLLLGFALVLALLRDAGILPDNHDVRIATGALPARPDVATAFRAFLAARPAGAPEKPVPVVLVATSSGGLAAGYWTATILGDLADNVPGFKDDLFAISAVSGGALGAVETLGMLQAGLLPAGCAGIRVCAQRALGADFLGPVLGSLLFPDLLQRFVPFPVFPDRAVALEKAWEARWRLVAGTDLMAGHFLSIWKANHPWPALLLNGTSVVRGDRLITSNLDFHSADMDVSIDAVDTLAALGADLPASSAVDTSTRFPLFGPVGVLRGRTGTRDLVVDGGYFEDFGATTLLETLDALVEVARRDRANVRFIVIQIVGAPPTEKPMHPITLLPRGLWGPLDTLLHTREARGTAATHALARRVAALGGVYASLRLGFSPTGQTAPLSWSLSAVAQHVIDVQWPAACREKLAAEMALTTQGKAMDYAQMMSEPICSAIIP